MIDERGPVIHRAVAGGGARPQEIWSIHFARSNHSRQIEKSSYLLCNGAGDGGARRGSGRPCQAFAALGAIPDVKNRQRPMGFFEIREVRLIVVYSRSRREVRYGSLVQMLRRVDRGSLSVHGLDGGSRLGVQVMRGKRMPGRAGTASAGRASPHPRRRRDGNA